MSEKKIVVPEGMLRDAMRAWGESFDSDTQPKILENILEAALLWLKENPISPTEDQAEYMYSGKNGLGHSATVQYCMTEWQRHMFLSPKKESK